ncbi:hypothetical protein [Anaeromyxobacter sp. SG64]|uniref:hypothetical protein n=1 Tax=Anaeromyxobacter sp. SG64 TaxID=2925409 RepID=UPI001F55E3FC|nr:hypothetical protein [Anaeromyxobacter sp. SG64]
MDDAIREILAALGKLDLSDWVAVYGAVLSTVLGVREWRRRSRIRVTIEAGQTVQIGGDERRQRFVRIDVINRSDYAVRVVSAGLYAGGQSHLFSGTPHMNLPADVRPHDAATFLIPFDPLMDLPQFRNRRVRAFAALSTGESYRSRRRTLRPFES